MLGGLRSEAPACSVEPVMAERALRLLAALSVALSTTFAASGPARAGESAAPSAVAVCAASTAPGMPPATGPFATTSGYHAALYSQSGYPNLCPGDKASLQITYVNTGSVSWDGTIRLGTSWYEPGPDQPSLLGGDGQKGSPATGWGAYHRPAPPGLGA